MRNKIKQTLVGLTLAAIAGCRGGEELKYNRGNVEVEARIESEEVESLAFNTGCYRVRAERQAVGYDIRIMRRVDFITGAPVGGCEDALPEIAQLISRVSDYTQPNVHCFIYDRNGNKSDFPMSSAEQVRGCSVERGLRDTEDCLSEMVSAGEKVKCEYR